MDSKVLDYFYLDDGRGKSFLKSHFISMIRNRIIDPNTYFILCDGFKYFLPDGRETKIPCDDSNWCEYETFKMGIEKGILEYPFTLKLFESTFWSVETKDEFDIFMEKVVDFRIKTIKRGWAIKYGASYEDEDFPALEDLNEFQLITWKDPRPQAVMKLDMITEFDILHGMREH